MLYKISKADAECLARMELKKIANFIQTITPKPRFIEQWNYIEDETIRSHLSKFDWAPIKSTQPVLKSIKNKKLTTPVLMQLKKDLEIYNRKIRK